MLETLKGLSADETLAHAFNTIAMMTTCLVFVLVILLSCSTSGATT